LDSQIANLSTKLDEVRRDKSKWIQYLKNQ
jgi:hypothetical protein